MKEERQRVANVIREAFHGVTLGNGIGLWEGQGLDDYENKKTIAEYRKRDEKMDWAAISIDQLNRCHSSLCFFDAEGMRFHLPAFLLAELEGALSNGIIFHLVNLDGYARSKYVHLTDGQRRAVREFLLLFEHDADFEFERPQIERSLIEYWKE